MRRSAGSFVRRKLNELLLFIAAGSGLLVGLSLGYVINQVMGAWLNGIWGSVVFGIAVLAVAIAYWLGFRTLERGWLDRLEKGENAEVRAGQFIEQALTAPGCAVAHSVTDISRVGDIDHLVATPVCLWVIETKYKKVPQENFQEVLRRIANNTSAVREWAPPGTLVRACLVLAYEKRIKRKNYDYGNERIAARTPTLLSGELEGEARRPRVLDEGIPSAVWKLGHVEA